MGLNRSPPDGSETGRLEKAKGPLGGPGPPSPPPLIREMQTGHPVPSSLPARDGLRAPRWGFLFLPFALADGALANTPSKR